MKQHDVFISELGWMGLSFSPQGVCRLVFDEPTALSVWQTLQASSGLTQDDEQDADSVAMTLRQKLCDYALGKRVSLRDIPVDWSGLTRFQIRVLQACRRIPWGQTRTYGQLAEEVGSPGAARAVGSVMSRNRLPLIVPCHRVVGSQGKLGGFSSRSGLSMKRRLLQMESSDTPMNFRPAELLGAV